VPPGKAARDKASALREAAPLLGLGMTLAVTALLGVGAGHWLDVRLGTHPLLLILGGSLGVAAALVYFVKTMTRSRDQADRNP
jgi:F0F1-type ATP synthase assembly protein I